MIGRNIWLLAAFSGLIVATSACAESPIARAPVKVIKANETEARQPITILISIDGFRADYIDRGITPTLLTLAQTGLRGAMRPSFPSKTFPNHQAIITGLRPDRNGIVGNRMKDPAYPGKIFTMASTDEFLWNEAEPIWAAAEKAGISTGIMFWPGSNVRISGQRPSNWHQFNGNITPAQRVDSILDWVRRPADTRPTFLTLYFDDVDTAGHHHGPDAPETSEAIAMVDAQIGRLRNGLKSMGQPANIVIVSDHGMGATSSDHSIPLYKNLSPTIADVVEEGPYASINPKAGKENALASILLKPYDNMRCYPKDNLPAHLKYGQHPRVPAFICLANMGWTIKAAPPKSPTASTKIGGNHGWDNYSPEMRAIFIANGPAFMAGKVVRDFDNVDVEPMLRQVIGLPPHDKKVDGSITPFRDVMLPFPPHPTGMNKNESVTAKDFKAPDHPL